ncbi:enoyl-CoA hydratase-related protein [candidate division KSB1 bacterium]
MMEFENLLYEVTDKTAIVTINRPDKANALNAQTLLDLMAAFSQLKIDPDVRVIILTGSGEKFFVAGADISEIIKNDASTGASFAHHGQDIFSLIENLGKPVIAAVNGFALGGGCELAMACSFRIASSNAKFGQPEAGLGVIPGYGGTQRLPRLVGKGRALELVLTGDMITAEEAYRIGLVNRVVEQAELLDTAKEIADKIITSAPLAVKYCLEAVNNGLNIPLADGLRLEAELFGLSCATEDMKTGMTAFLEKKGKADFKGK